MSTNQSCCRVKFLHFEKVDRKNEWSKGESNWRKPSLRNRRAEVDKQDCCLTFYLAFPLV